MKESRASTRLPEGSGLKRRAARGFLWAVVSYGGNKFVLFLSTLILTRLLVPNDFGVVAAGLAYMAYLEILLDMGLNAAVVYRQEEGHSKTVSTAFTLNFAACLLLAVLNFVLAPVLADFFQVQGQEWLFRALSVYVVVRGVGGLQTALLTRDLRFRDKGIADVVRAILRGGLGVGLAYAGLGAWALVWAFLAAEFGGTVTATALTRYLPRLDFDRAAARTLLRYGAPVAALALLAEVSVNSDYFVVGHVLGPVALGLYTIAFRLPELLLSNVYWMFSSVAFPVLSRARTGGVTAFRTATMRALRMLTLFAFPVAVGLALVSRDAVLVLFSAQWAGASAAMVLISLTIGFSCLGYASGDAYKAAGRPGTLLWINSVQTVVMLTGFIVAAPHGIVAVAAVHLCVSSVYGVVRLALANRVIGTTARDVVRAIAPSLCVAAGILAFALPLRLLLAPGATALVAIVGAGIVGGVLGLLSTGRGTLAEVVALLRELGRRKNTVAA